LKIREKVIPLFIALVLMVGVVAGSVSAAGPSNVYTGDLSNSYNVENFELSKEQLEMVELTQEHLKATTDANGNIKIEIVNMEEFEKKVNESDYPAEISDINNMIDSYNEYLTSSTITSSKSKKSIDGPNYVQVPVGGGGGTVDTSGISCGDALSIIGLLHSGSYAYAAYLLGVTGGLSVGIPFIIAAAYTTASILCD
jgi:hypothetical protein